jgi:hypothetical protein
MCNPRRIEITTTRQICEAWDREVRRMVEVSAMVEGAACVEQNLSGSVGISVLNVLEDTLTAGVAGWQPIEGGFRYAVHGGHAIYRPATYTLEIVAVATDQVGGWGEAITHLRGELQREVTERASARYFDDGYGGRTREVAEREARAAADSAIERAGRREAQQAADAAEAAEGQSVQAAAQARAQEDLRRKAEARRRELEARARESLAAVGSAARLAFQRLLAVGYRETLLSLARTRGATNVHCADNDGVLDIEFMLPD